MSPKTGKHKTPNVNKVTATAITVRFPFHLYDSFDPFDPLDIKHTLSQLIRKLFQ
ncbi:hypothetical protein Hanom_Chr01g00004661 [Helianthus anomalus]